MKPAWYRSICCSFLTLLACAVSARAASFKIENQTLIVPDGFEVEGLASEVQRPISGSFDEQGRLYVTDSSGANEKPDKQLEEKPHRVMRLEDTRGTGHFDKATVFADKMMFPEGCLWFNGSLYVSAPPSIWKLTDTNNDGIADVREEWHQGKSLTGCANDLHGPYLGPDGWIYWCKGAFAEQTYERPGKTPFVSRAAHIFRARPDHTGLEPVLTGGMDNPVSVAFTAEGERILCGTFFEIHVPGHRDGLIHAIYGGVYGKINEVTDAHKKTGELMPVMTHMGAAAPCSVIRYESGMFGEDYRNNLFLCSFNLHKVTRHILEPDGATFKTKDSDFLTSDDPDFHPTDAIEDADGSLIVLNTGGWYKICCPTSQLSKPDILGSIYRIRMTAAKRLDDPRGLKLSWASMPPKQLAALLGDQRPAVVRRAQMELGKSGSPAVSALAETLKKSDSADARRNAVWTLTRIDSDAARKAVHAALSDHDRSVRGAALHSVSLWRDAHAEKDLVSTLKAPDAQGKRIAAEALGRLGDKKAVPELLLASAAGGDRVLEHSLIYALIELNEPKSTAVGFKSLSAAENRAALIATDQMDSGKLNPNAVARLLGSPNPLLRHTASWIAGHHPEWGPQVAGFFGERLALPELGADQREELTRQLAQFVHSPAIQNTMASTLNQATTSPQMREVVLEAMASTQLKEVPTDWTWAIRESLADSEEAVLRSAISAARVVALAKTNAPNFKDVLLRIANDPNKPEDMRLEALGALPAGLRPVVPPELFTFLCANVDPALPVMTRNTAVGVLAKSKLSDDQLTALTDTVKDTGPLEMNKLLAAFEHTTNESVGLKLVSTLKQCKSMASLRPDAVKSLAAKYPSSVQQQAHELVLALNADAAKQAAHIDELLPEIKTGDIRRGQAVFNSQKAACATCHTMGYLGGKVGPDLTTIGQVRTERDLLESIVYPSASFVRSYEPYIVTTKSDETYSGVLKKDAPDEIVLATGPGPEVHVSRSDITEMRPGTVSVMPAGLQQQLTKQDLADLVAFLKGTKWGPR